MFCYEVYIREKVSKFSQLRTSCNRPVTHIMMRNLSIFYVYHKQHPVLNLGSVADHPPPSSGEIKNAWSCTSTPPIHHHVAHLV